MQPLCLALVCACYTDYTSYEEYTIFAKTTMYMAWLSTVTFLKVYVALKIEENNYYRCCFVRL